MIHIDNQKKLSVIIPVYRVEAHLEKCIDSLLRCQTMEYELILVDDGSPDGCPAICDRYRDRYEHIFVVHQENGGLAAARNTGLRKAKGTYVTFIDSDDTVEAGYLDQAVACTDTGDDIIVFSFLVEYTGDAFIRTQEVPALRSASAADAVRALEKSGAFNMVWNKLYRRELLEKEPATAFSLRSEPGEDLLFNSSCFTKAGSVSLYSEAYYHWIRRGEDTLANRFRKDLNEKNKRFIACRCELYRKLGMDKTDPQLLAKGNLGYIFSGVPNMYRGKNTFPRKDRIRFYKEILASDDAAAWVRDAQVSGSLLRQFIRIYRWRSPYLMDAYYAVAMGTRRRFDTLWQKIRKKTKT